MVVWRGSASPSFFSRRGPWRPPTSASASSPARSGAQPSACSDEPARRVLRRKRFVQRDRRRMKALARAFLFVDDVTQLVEQSLDAGEIALDVTGPHQDAVQRLVARTGKETATSSPARTGRVTRVQAQLRERMGR